MLSDRQERKVLRLHGLGFSQAHITNIIGSGPGPVATTIARGCTLDEARQREPDETCTGPQGEYLPDLATIEREKEAIWSEGYVDVDGVEHPPRRTNPRVTNGDGRSVHEKPRVPAANMTKRLKGD